MSADGDLSLNDYLVLEFPGGTMRGPGLALLADIMDAGVGRVLDLVFIHKDLDGSVHIIDASRLGGDADLDPALPEGSRSGKIGSAEIAAAGAHIDPGSSAGIVAYEKDGQADVTALDKPAELTRLGA